MNGTAITGYRVTWCGADDKGYADYGPRYERAAFVARLLSGPDVRIYSQHADGSRKLVWIN